MSVKLITPKRFEDERGWFAETYNMLAFQKRGIEVEFRQDNHSYSKVAGVLRGLHFQHPPFAQAKLVRCVRGSIWDVAVDVRDGSPSYGEFVSCELNAKTGQQLFIPIGFAHGFVTLEDDTEVEYKCSALYARHAEGGVVWNDPDLRLPWPIEGEGPFVSDKDKGLPKLSALQSPFAYDGEPLSLCEV